MKKQWKTVVFLLMALLLLQGRAKLTGTEELLMAGNLQLPSQLSEAVPEAAELLEPEAGGDFGLASGISALWNQAMDEMKDALLSGAGSVAALLAGVLLLGVAEESAGEGKGSMSRVTIMVGTLWITAVTAGNLDALIGLGQETVSRMSDLGALLLPALAAAAAASGSVTAASVRQVAAVFFSDMLLTVIHRLFIPMVYLYIGVATAEALLEGDTLSSIGRMLKKVIIWGLSLLLGLFTTYLSVSGAVAGTADATAVKAAQAAVSTVVPVVGNILAQAAEGILAGAGLLRGLLGVFGMLAVLAICLVPFLHLGMQYLLYQGAAVVAEAAAPPRLARLMKRLGEAFMLVLAMTAASAMLLLITIISSCKAVLP